MWAANVPGDFSQLSDATLALKHRGRPMIHVGANDDGQRGFKPLCPRKGTHRYRFNLWILNNYVSNGSFPLPPSTKLREVLPAMRLNEVAQLSWVTPVVGFPVIPK